MFTTFTPLYRNVYGFGEGVVGLSYCGLGVGCIIGQFYVTWVGDRLYMNHVRKGDAKPEHRLTLMIQGAVMMPIGFFWYGWSAQAHVHWIVPIIGTGIVGLSLLLIWMPASTYLVDCFQLYAASAMAASTVLRSLCGAIVPLAGQKMYQSLGYGWGNSVLAFIAIVFMPTPILFTRYGEYLRTRFKVNL
jgi:MFS family permease